MIPVSAEWQEGIREKFRLQGFLRISLEVVPPGLVTGIPVATDDTFEYSDAKTLTDHIENIGNVYASLDPNRWTLDGAVRIFSPEDTTPIWWSNNPEQTQLDVEFTKPYSLLGLTITWDTDTHSWPQSFTIRSKSATNQYVSTTFHPKEVREFYQMEMEDVVNLTITILEWNKPNWCPRISEIILGMYLEFDNLDRILSAKAAAKTSPLSQEQPSNSLQVVLRNLDKYFDPQLKIGVSKHIVQKQIMKAAWGFMLDIDTVEWTPELTYIVDNLVVAQDSKNATLNFTNRLALLTHDFKLGTYTGTSRTLYELAQYVLENSDILLETESISPWYLDPTLKNHRTTAPIPSLATNVILQYIALAGCCYLRTRATDGFVVLQSTAGNPSVQTIDEDQEIGDPSIEVIDRLRSVSLMVYNYTKESESRELGKAELYIKGTQLVTVDYNVNYAVDVSVQISGATIKSSKFYASRAVLELEAPVSGATVSVILTGYQIVATSSTVETFRDSTVANGLDISIDNPLITGVSNLGAITDNVVKYYSRRTRYAAPYLGYPELEAGDRIDLSTVYGSSSPDVVEVSLDFNGGWSGKVTTI